MSALIPGSLETQTRGPLDGKYPIPNSEPTVLESGLTFVGLQRFSKLDDKLWIKLSTGWTEIVTQSSVGTSIGITIGNIVTGAPGTSVLVTNSGTLSNPIFNFTIPRGNTGVTPVIDIGAVYSGNTASVTRMGTAENPIFDFVLPIGPTGESIWIAYSTYSTGQYATTTLNSTHRFISIVSSVSEPPLTAYTTWVKFVGDPGGPAGQSSYQLWLASGNTGTEAQFLASLKGSNGLSAYQQWLALGNVGTEAQFIASLQATASDVNKAYVDAADNSIISTITSLTTNNIAEGTNVNRKYFKDSQRALLEAPITGTDVGGTTLAYATAQLAATDLGARGGGVINSKVDIEGPLILTYNVSLYAPGRTLYIRTNTLGTDTLTLQNHTGVVECKLIERTTAGRGYAVVVTNGSPTIKANLNNTQGYNALYSTSANVNYQGNITFTNPTAFAGGERIAALSIGGVLDIKGNITVYSDDSLTEGIVSFNGAEIIFNGVLAISNKGRLARAQNATLSLRGVTKTNDIGVLSLNSKVDIYTTIDTRTATAPTTANSPLIVARNDGNIVQPATTYTRLHVGSELLSPTGVYTIFNSNSSSSLYNVEVVGLTVQNTTIDPGVTLVYLTPQPTGGGGSSTPPTATSTVAGIAKLYNALSTSIDGGITPNIVNGVSVRVTETETQLGSRYAGTDSFLIIDEKNKLAGRYIISTSGVMRTYYPGTTALKAAIATVVSGETFSFAIGSNNYFNGGTGFTALQFPSGCIIRGNGSYLAIIGDNLGGGVFFDTCKVYDLNIYSGGVGSLYGDFTPVNAVNTTFFGGSQKKAFIQSVAQSNGATVVTIITYVDTALDGVNFNTASGTIVTYRGQSTYVNITQANGTGLGTTYLDFTPQTAVRKVNSIAPDVSGNVTISGGGGTTAGQLEIVRNSIVFSTSQAAAYTLAFTDVGNIIPSTSATVQTWTIPANIFTIGQIVEVLQNAAGQITLVGGAGMTLTGSPGLKTSGSAGSRVQILFTSATTAYIYGTV